MTDAAMLFAFMALAELGVIYGLVNRILSGAGHRTLKPAAKMTGMIFPDTPLDTSPVDHDPGRKVASMKVRL
jgi:hypothetical protein